LLFFDLNNKSSTSNPENKLNNPNQLVQYSSFYSGIWQYSTFLSYLLFHTNILYLLYHLTYTIGSIGKSSIVIYFAREAKPNFISAYFVAVAVIAKVIIG